MGPSEPTARIFLLGRFGVEVQGRAIPASSWRKRRPIEVLVALALATGRVLHREELIDRLWPDRDLEAGATSRSTRRRSRIRPPSRERDGPRRGLYLNGEELSSMEGGMSYAQVQSAVARSANVVSDPPRELTLDLAREHVAALDDLPRPTLVTCRAGPRASAVAYMYSGLRAGAEPEAVIAEAEQQGAPFCKFDDYKDWVRASILELRREQG